MSRLVVVSFGTHEYEGSLASLRHSALTVGEADEVLVFTERDVAEFFAARPELLSGSRGYGWWSWKPYLLDKVLRERPDGDVVVWCDAAMEFTDSLRPYAAAASTHRYPVVLARLGGWSRNDYRNAAWTKPSALHLLETTGEGVQVNAAFQVYAACDASRTFVAEYLRLCCIPAIVSDEPGSKHRHDQSVLTALAERFSGCLIVRDPTQWGRDDPRVDDVADIAPAPVLNHHRKRLPIPKIVVITPTTGGEHLEACVRSVQASTVPVEHWVVTDGPEHRARVAAVLDTFRNRHPIVDLVLPRNTGAGGWNGHRIYASVPFLTDAHFVAFLDDDNMVDPDHYEALLRACLESKRPWAFSLRRIIDSDGTPVCEDNCESLGGILHTPNGGPGDFLIDTSCYFMRRSLALETCTAWNVRARDPSGKEPDRELAKRLLSTAQVAVVRKHSLAYRCGSNALSVRKDYFLQHNARLGYDFARKRDLYVFHFSQEATADMMAALRTRPRTRSYALDEWQKTLFFGLDDSHNIINGYECLPNIPPEADVFVCLCDPGQVPMAYLAQRADLHRVVYTLESPNIRHAAQWDVQWLANHFDVACTYHAPLLADRRMLTVFTPHNCHHGDMDDPLDRAALLRANTGSAKACAMVLERRPRLFGTREYVINGVKMRCLDYLREDLVRGLKDVTVYGIHWDAVADGVRIKLGHALHRSKDPRTAVDILSGYEFAVIVENTDAEGYCSEKLYDALSAGAIPLYYGSVPPQLGIPEGPENGVYIDLRKREIATGAALQTLIDQMSPESVAAMKRRIVDVREEILRRVGTKAFAECARAGIELARKSRKQFVV